MTYPIDAVRAAFPALSEGAAHFDAPGGSLIPEVVGDAVRSVLGSAVCQRGSVTAAERRTERIVVDARQAMADLLGVEPRGVVFGRSMTQLTFDLARTLARSWGPDDEIVVSRLDHDANIRPWVYAAEGAGASVRWIEFDARSGEIGMDEVESCLSSRTRLVAVTAASNLIGTRPPIREIADRVHERGALLYVDGVHFTPHAFVDVAEMGADVYSCSPYKFCGPHLGVLAAAPALLETLAPEKLLPSTSAVPERFELGTLPYELLAGTTAAVEFLAGLGDPSLSSRRERLRSALAAVERHEDGLRRTLEDGLVEHRSITVYSRARERTPTLLFTVAGSEPRDVSARLARSNINAPAGSFYALEASRRIGLGEAGGVRLGLAPYSCTDDVHRLLEALRT